MYKRTELKNKMTKMKNTLEGINSSRWYRDCVSDLEDRILEITQPEQQIEKQILKTVTI